MYLPPGYSRARRYPVVYLLHGMPGSPSEYLAGTDLAGFADAAITSGRLRPFIAVLPAAGADRKYDGEWAGPWERELVDQVVPFVDAHLADGRDARGSRDRRALGGRFRRRGHRRFGIPALFGTVESWSGYFHPLRDGPFKHATRAVLAAHDPTRLVEAEQLLLVDDQTRFFLSTGPPHSRWAPPSATIDYAGRLRSLGLPYTLRIYPNKQGEWRNQLDDGLRWALAPPTHT